MTEQPVKSRRILLADDQAEVRATLKLILELEEHTIVEACDGKEALRLFDEGPFDLVITDYVMPEMSGDMLALEIKKRAPVQPIIMITAHAELLPYPVPGVDVLLSKPFQISDLRSAIARVV